MTTAGMPIFYPAALVKITATVYTSLRDRETEDQVFVVQPVSVEIERNDYNQADACTIELAAPDFPILPRNLAEVLIQVYMGDVGGLDDAATKIQDDRFLRFIGYVDSPEMALSETQSVIRWKARDYTALLIDTKRPSASIVPSYADRLDVALRRILDAVPGGDALGLVLEGLDEWPELATAAPPGLAAAKIPVRPEDTQWHLIKRACEPVALIPEFRLDALVVHPSRGLQTPVRRPYFAYGGNLTEWHEKRDLQRLREGIGLRAFNMETGQFDLAIYPPSGDVRLDKKGRRVATSKNGAKRKVKVLSAGPGAVVDPSDKRKWFPYDAVPNHAALEDAAEAVYLGRARQEFEGSFTCTDMQVADDQHADDLDGSADFDVLDIRSGDRVMIDVWPQQRQLLGGFQDSDSRVAFLVDDGYDPAVASALVAAFEDGVSGPIEVYVRKATASISESGFSVKVDFEALLEAGST